ncbi:protein LONG AFTER FAR-RED 3 isoform X4 [Elaeis guineensis]|uniref:Protein LONG AFTER FAR-RED 3 isoform X4 n=1 Tax=Elaeis guineensis var. tenera TaxID=51953 RepID=A0A8N4IBP4_ELAGV|nr:protein LONG AFTER FAR-RED 3 isoform X4 [Elaeis guineensis]
MGKNLLTFLSAAGVALLAILLLPALNPSRSLWKWRRTSADLVVMNATIYTSDPSFPFAEAMAIRNGRILRVGNYSSVKDPVGYGTRELNLNGKVVMPGFIDSHVHFISGGLQMGRVELRGVKSQDSFAKKVKEAVKDKVPGEWVLGGGWNNDLWGGDLPCTSWINDISSNNPVWLSRMDGHMGLANSLALKIAGITNDTHDPVGGTIVKTNDGDVYKWADSAGKMLIRVCLFFPIQTWSQVVDLFQERGRELSQWIYLGGVKAFADGSLGSNSALFYEPYEDDPDNYGLQVTDIDWLLNATLESDKSRVQVAIHAIGDKANDMVLDMFDSVVSFNGMRDRRFRIEHAQHLAQGTTTRFGQQKVIASVQPDHLLYDADSAEKKLGAFRAQKSSYLFRSLLAGDALLAFGSDWPVVDIYPLEGIKTAMSRVPPGWDTAWIPSERIALDDALKAHTISAAYACFLDHDLGSLSAGKYADFVVLPADSWDEFSNDLPSSVLATYVNGVQAYP